MKQWILAVIVIGFSLQASAFENSCEFLFSPRGVLLNTEEFSLVQQTNPKFINSLTLNILQMTSFSKSTVFTEKNVVEKGELVLARPLENGWSLEFEYAADYRGRTPVFRLKEIDLVKPNGEVTTLDKTPNTTEGDALKKDFYAFEGMDVSLADARVSMPQAIHSPIFERVMRWATLADYLKRDEIQALKEGSDLRGMRGKVFVRSTIDYTNKVIKKQSFKFFLLGMAMYFYSQKDVITNEIVVIDPWDKMKVQSDLGLSDEKKRKDMGTLLSKMTEKKIELGRIYNTNKSFNYSDFDSALADIEILNRLERKEASKPIVALWDGIRYSTVSFKKLGLSTFDSLDEESALAIYFPRTERIVLIASPWLSYSASSDLVLPYLLKPGNDIEGSIYNILKDKIKTIKSKESK